MTKVIVKMKISLTSLLEVVFQNYKEKRKNKKKTKVKRKINQNQENIESVVKCEMIRYQSLAIINNTADSIKWCLAERDSYP